jgi:hypothetical protein
VRRDVSTPQTTETDRHIIPLEDECLALAQSRVKTSTHSVVPYHRSTAGTSVGHGCAKEKQVWRRAELSEGNVGHEGQNDGHHGAACAGALDGDERV